MTIRFDDPRLDPGGIGFRGDHDTVDRDSLVADLRNSGNPRFDSLSRDQLVALILELEAKLPGKTDETDLPPWMAPLGCSR